MAERLMTLTAFAKQQRTTARQLRRWIAEGLAVTSSKPPRVRVDAAAAWLRARRDERSRSSGEVRRVLEDRTGDIVAEFTARVRQHVPGVVVDRLWSARCRRAELLRTWPAIAAPRLAARLRGEDTPIQDPRMRDPAATALFARVPAAPIAVALFVQAEARGYLEQHAAAFNVSDPEAERIDAEERERWLKAPAFAAPRAVLDAWRARATRFTRVVRRGEWEPTTTVATRWENAIVSARQRFLDRAPTEMMRLPAGAGEPAIRGALAVAVEAALDELHRGDRRPR